jgi:hypothetical protein
MFWGPNDVWTTEIAVDKSSVLEYKYVLMDSYGQAKAWQQGNNGVLAIKPSQNELTVHDNWCAATLCLIHRHTHTHARACVRT